MAAGKKDPRIDEYIAQAAPFAQPILRRLRKVVRAACPEANETIKWSMPFWEFHGVLCMMSAFKRHCAFGFWNGKMVVGKTARGDEAMGDLGKIESPDDLPSDEVLLGLVRKAATMNASGIKPDRTKKKPRAESPTPADLAAALKKNAKARTTFENFSPSHRREYIEWITEAKRDETRQKRLATTIEWLAEGKSREWKYQAKKGSGA